MFVITTPLYRIISFCENPITEINNRIMIKKPSFAKCKNASKNFLNNQFLSVLICLCLFLYDLEYCFHTFHNNIPALQDNHNAHRGIFDRNNFLPVDRQVFPICWCTVYSFDFICHVHSPFFFSLVRYSRITQVLLI